MEAPGVPRGCPGPLDGENQLIHITGFLKIRIGPGVNGVNGRPLRGVAGQQDALDSGGVCLEGAQQFQPGYIFQLQVDQGHVNSLSLHLG